jgi:hypothetical protein
MLIGFMGYPGSGKDLAASFLVTQGFSRFAFADKLRAGLLGVNPIVHVADDGSFIRLQDVVREIGWEAAKRKYDEIRRLLQHYGTEGGRAVHGSNCWVDIVERGLKLPACLTDVRFDTEIALVNRYSGYLVCIRRPGIVRTTSHSSEELDYSVIADVVIDNDGSEDEFRVKVLSCVSEIEKGLHDASRDKRILCR